MRSLLTFATLFFVINLVVAIASFVVLGQWLGGGFIGYVTSALTAFVLPTVAGILAMIAAIQVWDWPWLVAALVFIWPTLISLFGSFVGASATSFALLLVERAKGKHHDHPARH